MNHFRSVLYDLFLSYLNRVEPDHLILDLDTTVLDNDSAHRREGVGYTYKEVRGFQPLLLKCRGRIVESLFRGGSTSGNNKDKACKMLARAIDRIREHYREDVPIIITADGGFFDGKVFELLEDRDAGYLIGGRLDELNENLINSFPQKEWKQREKENGTVYRMLLFSRRCEG